MGSDIQQDLSGRRVNAQVIVTPVAIMLWHKRFDRYELGLSGEPTTSGEAPVGCDIQRRNAVMLRAWHQGEKETDMLRGLRRFLLAGTLSLVAYTAPMMMLSPYVALACGISITPGSQNINSSYYGWTASFTGNLQWMSTNVSTGWGNSNAALGCSSPCSRA